MNYNLDFIYNRVSVRKFKDIEVPEEDIKEIIKAATYAPSGKNLQNWHFVVLRNKDIINKMGDIVEKRHIEIANMAEDTKTKEKFMKFLKYHTAFKNAPVVILVYCTPYPYLEYNILKESGANEDTLKMLSEPAPHIQNVSAAMENLLLAASTMGYGGCWMTGPNYSITEIGELLGFEKEGYNLMAMTPIGVPEENKFPQPPRKSVEEVTTFID